MISDNTTISGLLSAVPVVEHTTGQSSLSLSRQEQHNQAKIQPDTSEDTANKANLKDKQLADHDRQKLKEESDKLFDALNTGLALKFHEKSGKWYAIIENKITHQVVKEIPPKYMLDLQAKLKEMIGVFLDKKI